MLTRFDRLVLYDMGGMAFDANDSLYVTIQKDLYRVSSAGAVSTIARDIGGAGANTSILGVTVDGSGNVYAADFGNREVVKIAASGTLTTVLKSEDSWSPTGVAFRNGRLYILESGSHGQKPRVSILSNTGKLSILASVGETAAPPAPPASEQPKPTPSVGFQARVGWSTMAAGTFLLTFVLLNRRAILCGFRLGR